MFHALSKRLVVFVTSQLFSGVEASGFQMILIPANQPRQQLLPMLARVLPQYTFVGETVTGHTNVFEWKVCTAILHMTLPITPVYIGILLLRRRIVAMLSVNAMSESTKKIHKQLLRVGLLLK